MSQSASTFRVFDVSTGVFATRTYRATLDAEQAIAFAAGATRQPEDVIREALAMGPTGNPGGATRIPASASYGGAGCVDLEPVVCAACDGTGTVVEVEPVGDGTVSHTFPCVCPRGRELDAARHEEDEVDRLVRESEPDSVELAAQREAVAMRDWACSCDRGEGRIDRGCEVHGAGVEA